MASRDDPLLSPPEPQDYQVWFAVCLERLCDWVSEMTEYSDDVPQECAACGGDVSVETDWVY